MSDMNPTIAPKSDQMNADDLIGGPRTIRIRDVQIAPGTEQPVAVYFDGDDGKPYLPCKSMRRVMVAVWGADAKEYHGRRMTLYRDPSVTWGGMEVGGIRISHMSHLDKQTIIVLTATKKQRKPFTVQPLLEPPEPVSTAPKRTVREIVRDRLVGCGTTDDVADVADLPLVAKALKDAPEDVRKEISDMLAHAYARVAQVEG